MKPEIKLYLEESRSANDIKHFIIELVDSPGAEDVYREMALVIRELSDTVRAVKREVNER